MKFHNEGLFASLAFVPPVAASARPNYAGYCRSWTEARINLPLRN
jgi:hypothetical protein